MTDAGPVPRRGPGPVFFRRRKFLFAIAALVATIALALLLTWLVGKLERLLTPWRQEA